VKDELYVKYKSRLHSNAMNKPSKISYL